MMTIWTKCKRPLNRKNHFISQHLKEKSPERAIFSCQSLSGQLVSAAPTLGP